MSGEPLTVLAPDGLNTLVTATEAAAIAGVTAQAVRNWKMRGLIEPAGLDERNRPLYRLADIVKAERKTRKRNWGTRP
jgi:DNA-binding transcriptional MerR regulator